MHPGYVIGDLVEFGIGTMRRTAIVVSVQESTQVPDARVRGIEGVFPWAYWVFDGSKMCGPITGGWLKRVN